MLSINNLKVSVEGNEILKGLHLAINPGEVHAIMGTNRSGNSTLFAMLAGCEEYEVTAGYVTFKGKDLLKLAPEERTGEGVFLAFQYPVEISPALVTTSFCKHRSMQCVNIANSLHLIVST